AAVTLTQWEPTPPIPTPDGLLAISPDGMRLIRLDTETGAVTGERELSDIGWPDYLLRAGDRLVGISDTAATVLPINNPLDAPARTFTLPDGPQVGRAIVAGEAVLVPTESGVTILSGPGAEPRSVALEHSGSVVVADGQLLVVDASSVHGYLDWASAERVLTERIAANPADPQHAIALAELADRSGRAARIPGAADDAADAIDRIENPAAAARAIARLFQTLLAALDRPEGLPGAIRGELVARLERRATTAEHRVAHLMRLGDERTGAGRHREAAAAYQRILLDESLAQAEHAANWRRQRADRAARAALVSLVADHGEAVYREFDRAARDQLRDLQSLPDQGDPLLRARSLERLATNYPIARSTPAAWLDAARAFDLAGRPRDARAALRSGFDAAGRIPGRAPERRVLAEIAGELATRLADADRVYEAAWVLRRGEAMLGQLRLAVDGEPIDAAAFERRIRERLASRDRAPRIDPQPDAVIQQLAGWLPVPPASRSGATPTGHVVLRSLSRGVVALWSTTGATIADDPGLAPIDGNQLPDPETEGLRPIWSRPLGVDLAAQPELVRLTASDVLLYRGPPDRATLEMIDAVSGETRWTSAPFADAFDARPARLDTGVVVTPLDGSARLREHVIAIDDDHAAIIERSGRTLLIDLRRGETLWAERLPVPAVYEASLRDGVLGIIGERPGTDTDEPRRSTGAVPVVAAYDITTRAALFGPTDTGSYPRWIRHQSGGPMILGLDAGVAAIDLDRGEIAWTIDDPAVRLSGDAWLAPGRAYVLGADDRRLWQIDLATGTLRADPLEDLGRIGQGEAVRVHTLPTGRALFCTDRGMITFEPDGSLAGGDGYDGSRSFVLPARAEGVVVAVTSRSGAADAPADRTGSSSLFGYAAFDENSGRLLAEATLALREFPRRLIALDDTLVLGLANGTAVISAPAATDR
ncbi:MAG: hypothetical protein AAGF47_11250, partial [Planctomycetota bacterium]